MELRKANKVLREVQGDLKKKNKELLFTEKYFECLNKLIENLTLIELSELIIKTEYNDEIKTHYLDNAYSEVLRGSNETEIIEKYLESTISLYQPKSKLDTERIIPNIKDSRYLTELKNINNGKIESLVYEKYNEDLYIFYAEDLEHSIEYLNQEDLTENNIQINSLKELSVNNLMDTIPNIERNGDNGYFWMLAGGLYESSLILNSSIWNYENFPVDGEIVIGIPSRDVLIITGSNDADNLKNLKGSVVDINETGDHIVSNKLFVFRNGQFEVFDK